MLTLLPYVILLAGPLYPQVTTSQLQGRNAAIPGGGNRPNSVGRSARIGAGRSRSNEVEGWFDISAFTIPAPFTFGNVGRTLPDVRSPAFTNFDMALGEQFKL
jgi:hypothetical protein